MAKDNDGLFISASLDLEKTLANIESDIKEISSVLANDKNRQIKFIGSLDLNQTSQKIKSQISEIINGLNLDLGKIIISDNINTKNISKQLNEISLAGNTAKESANSLTEAIRKTSDINISSVIPKEIRSVSSSLTDVTGYLKTYYEQFGEVSKIDNKIVDKNGVEKLTDFTIKVKSATGEIEKFKYALDDSGENFLLKNINSADSGVNKLIESVKKFNVQIDSSIAELNQQLSNVQSKYSSTSSNKYISDESSKQALSAQYNSAVVAINDLKNADNITMKQMQTNAKIEIERLQNLADYFYKASHAATALRTKDIDTIKVDEGNHFEGFIAQLNNLKAKEPILKLLSSDINEVKTSLANISDPASLTEYLNKFSNLQSKANTLKEIFRGFGKEDWFSSNREQIDNISNISAKAKIYQSELKKLRENWKEQGIEVGGIKEKAVALTKTVGSIKSPETFAKWVEDFDELRFGSERVNNNLQKQIAIQNQIYAHESQITALSVDKDKNSEQLALLEQKLSAEKQNLNNAQMLSNVYGNLVSLEEQEKIVIEGTAQAREKYNAAVAKSNDKTNSKALLESERESKNRERESRNIETYRLRIEKLIQTIKAWQNENGKAMHSSAALNSTGGKTTAAYTNEIISSLGKILKNSNATEKELKQMFTTANLGFAGMKAETKALGNSGNTLLTRFKDSVLKFSKWMSLTHIISSMANQVRGAVSELFELNTILTEISKTSNRSQSELEKLGDTAFGVASNYGADVKNYLLGIQEMNRAGFQGDIGDQMAQLSLLTQTAGDVTSETANDYLIATNAAYDYKGSLEQLQAVLDGQNEITNNASVSMQDMADATKEAASMAAQTGVEVDELSAIITTAVSKTRQSGSEAGNAIKSLFINLQNTSNRKIVNEYDKLGVSMTKIVDGSEQLKTPIELLKELSQVYNSLPEDDVNRSELLTVIGGKYHANTFAALLTGMQDYEQALEYYSNGGGSAYEEAQKTVNSLEGQLNVLNNMWVEFIHSSTSTDMFKNIIDSVKKVMEILDDASPEIKSLLDILGEGLDVISTLAEQLGLFPMIAAGLSFKNVGRGKMISLNNEYYKYADCA